MDKIVEVFLEQPTAENFEKVRQYPCYLVEIFRKNEELAKDFFSFSEWFLIHKEVINLTLGEKPIIKAFLTSSVSSFSDAIKYYYSLAYDDRMAWQKNFISYANTVKDLQYVLNLVGRSYRKEIVEKMQSIAFTDEEKKITSYYKVGWLLFE